MNDEASIRERILDAALGLFLSKGYNGSNLRDIARESRVSMGGIYHHFESKEAIYKELLTSGSFAGDLREIMVKFNAPEFPENLAEIGAAIFRTARRNRDYLKLFYIDVLEFQGRNITHVVKAMRSMVGAQAEKLLGPRQEAGEVIDVRAAVIMRCITDLFLYFQLEEIMLEHSLADQLGITEEALAGEMARVLLHGILPDSGQGS